MAKAKETVKHYWKEIGGRPKAKRKVTQKKAWEVWLLLIRVFCFFKRFPEDDWRRLWSRWTTLVILRCGSVALGAALLHCVKHCGISVALREIRVLVSSCEMLVRSSITFTSIRTQRLFAHRYTFIWLLPNEKAETCTSANQSFHARVDSMVYDIKWLWRDPGLG